YKGRPLTLQWPAVEEDLGVESLTFRRDHAGVETGEVEATVESGVFNFHAAVHDNGHAEVFGNLGCFIGPDAQLQPEVFGADGGCFLGDLRGVFGATEHIDHIDLYGNVFQGGIDRVAQNLTALFGQDRVDEIDVVGRGGQQVGRHEIRGALELIGCPNDGDRFDIAQDVQALNGTWAHPFTFRYGSHECSLGVVHRC